jgi:hypothetical protein
MRIEVMKISMTFLKYYQMGTVNVNRNEYGILKVQEYIITKPLFRFFFSFAVA